MKPNQLKLPLLLVAMISPFWLWPNMVVVWTLQESGRIHPFGLTLLGVALFHEQTFWVAIIGLSCDRCF